MARKTAEERFWPKVDKGPLPDDCWLWCGGKDQKGYGNFAVETQPARVTKAHRFAYERLVEPIPAGLQLDHLCRNRACVNPSHLEVVTGRENVLRGRGPGLKAKQTHCKRGHEFTPENTYVQPSRPTERICRECRRLLDRKRALNKDVPDSGEEV